MKNNANNKNRANNCKDKMETSKVRSKKQTEEKNRNSSNFKSSMENSDY